MIETKVKIHDKFAFEIKTSFYASRGYVGKEAEFNINMWTFLPNALDINRNTYPKEEFYKDTISKIRLITPIYSLDEIYTGENSPLSQLLTSISELQADPNSEEKVGKYTYQVKMFSSIVKSAIRDKVLAIEGMSDELLVRDEIHILYQQLSKIITSYKETWNPIFNIQSSYDLQRCYLFGEEFLGNVVEQHLFLLLRFLESKPNLFGELKESIVGLITQINSEKQNRGFPIPNSSDEESNSLLIIRRSLLKKYIESDLYLTIKKTKDGRFAQQFYYGLAAAISMIFATIVSFSAQLHYGSFTTPLFFALVISYVFKDRIKELMRYYFSTQLGKKYFDLKRKLAIRDLNIGFEKEAFDFVDADKLPNEVAEKRRKSPLVEAENAIYGETILLYRKNVHLFPEKMGEYVHYKLSGINDITRISIVNFIQKMDNPDTSLYLPDEEKGYQTVKGTRLYSLYLILRCQSETNIYYKQYRLLFNRNGIKSIREIAS